MVVGVRRIQVKHSRYAFAYFLALNIGRQTVWNVLVGSVKEIEYSLCVENFISLSPVGGFQFDCYLGGKCLLVCFLLETI